jgi:hypothetical protein
LHIIGGEKKEVKNRHIAITYPLLLNDKGPPAIYHALARTVISKYKAAI